MAQQTTDPRILLVFNTPLLQLPSFRGELVSDPSMEGKSTLKVAIGRGMVSTRRNADAVYNQILSRDRMLPSLGLKCIVLLVYRDAAELCNRIIQTEFYAITRIEVHFIDRSFPGYREVYQYTKGRADPSVTLVIPSAFIKTDGGLTNGMFMGGSLNKVECAYIFDSPDVGIPPRDLLHRILLFLTRFKTLRALHVSPSLVGDNYDDRELNQTLAKYHPKAGNYFDIQ
ncbi:hypothetical protein CPC08DRAFT_768965 [Agrocybe pediades]|nr:hypothetical protein CPC08DRAFT_768965 [Agrocybe pediades]